MNRTRTAIVALLLVVSAASPAAAGLYDTDGDGLRDTFEKRSGVTSPTNPDTDGDGVVDSAEDNDGDRLGNKGEQKFGLDPGRRDSDGDGRPDGREDADRDGRSNAVEQDHRPVPAGLRPSLASAVADVSPYKAGCQTTAGRSDIVTCSYGPANSPTTVVLMGDSHAMQLATPIVTVAEENGWRLTTLVKKACPPVLGIHNNAQKWADDGASCRAWRWNALRWLNENPPDHVILAHSDSYGISTFKGERITGHDRAPVWKAGMKRTLGAMPASSEVIVLGDIPYNRVNPVGCLRRNKKNISKCVTSRQPLYKRKIELAIEQAVTVRGATFRRFYNKVCTYDPCPIIQGDVLMYRDRGHFTATFAAQLTPTFRKMLTPLVGIAPAARGKR
ncbi:MAG: SGNH hydrolase domain-containing protein [Candidatus Limnocylindrales bacterium]